MNDLIAVYKVSGANTSSVYYGYAPTDLIRDSFLAGCHRVDSETTNRGDYRLLQSNDGDETTLVFDVIDQFDNEFDAWCARNDLRAQDSNAITGPSILPVVCNRRAAVEQPARVALWNQQFKLSSCVTALEAYQLGAYTFAQITAASQKHGKEHVKTALATLNPSTFVAKFLC